MIYQMRNSLVVLINPSQFDIQDVNSFKLKHIKTFNIMQINDISISDESNNLYDTFKDLNFDGFDFDKNFLLLVVYIIFVVINTYRPAQNQFTQQADIDNKIKPKKLEGLGVWHKSVEIL